MIPQPSITQEIVLNQLGYLPHIKKEALFISDSGKVEGTWHLIDVATKKVVARGILPKAKADQHSPLYTQTINFSYITQQGRYRLAVKNLHSTKVNAYSVEFDINHKVYQPLIIGLLRSYYLQRCGFKIEDQVTGMKRPACHLKDGTIAHHDAFNQQGKRLFASGGWHDAGDYGKYIAPAAVVLLELLSRYERYEKELSSLNLSIPESNNNKSDFLDEMKIALDWMLTMQRVDGAVYRKLSGKQWPHQLTPEQDQQTRVVYGISSQETGKAIAAWALAARIYQKYDPVVAQLYLKAALQSWQWLEKQENTLLDEYDNDNSGSGPYTFNSIDQDKYLRIHVDDKFAAAMELYLTGKKPELANYLSDSEPHLKMAIMEWKNPSAQAMLTSLWHPKAQDNLSIMRSSLRAKLKDRAAAAYQRTTSSAFGLANHRFIWGSNKMAAQEGVLLAQAAYYFKQKAYRDAAWDQFHYLMGRNAFNQTFVSGFGTHPVKNVNHLYSKASGFYIVGLHVGGPNNGAQAGIAPKNKNALSYIDSDQSYATNEYAIDYNSALLSLLFDLLYLDKHID
ncbi:MAG: glycoside hydrolase family 9 protein [bacterium]